MLIFSRRATWSQDVDLFRAGAADADQLEALMAAIAIQSQSLWVGEYDQQPVAFIWVVLDDLQLHLARLFVLPEYAQCGVLASLLARLYEHFGDRAEKILAKADDIEGVDDDALRAAGFEKTGANCWELPLALDDETP